MELLVFTEEACQQISSDMAAIAQEVVAGTFDMEEYFGAPEDAWTEQVEYPITLPETLRGRQAGEGLAAFDARIAREFYGTTAALSKRQASDGRLWMTLALKRYRSYVANRFFERDMRQMAAFGAREVAPSSTFCNKAKRHFCFSGRPSSKMFDNGISRLWWFSYLVRDDDAADPLHLLPTLLVSEDFAARFCASLVSWSKDATLGILDAVGGFLATDPEIGSVNRFLVKDFVQYLNQRSLVMRFDCFSREEMAEYCLRHLVESASELGESE